MANVGQKKNHQTNDYSSSQKNPKKRSKKQKDNGERFLL